MVRYIAGLAVVLISIAAITVNGAVIYANDFEAFAGSEWSNASANNITSADSCPSPEPTTVAILAIMGFLLLAPKEHKAKSGLKA